jgi:hypothetical protein
MAARSRRGTLDVKLTFIKFWNSFIISYVRPTDHFQNSHAVQPPLGANVAAISVEVATVAQLESQKQTLLQPSAYTYCDDVKCTNLPLLASHLFAAFRVDSGRCSARLETKLTPC